MILVYASQLKKNYGLAFRLGVQDGYCFYDIPSFKQHAELSDVRRKDLTKSQDESSNEEQFWKKIAE